MKPVGRFMSSLFEYALLRIVPRPERGESINAGVVLYAPENGFLGARVHLDTERLRALDPGMDPETVYAHLRAVILVCRGGPEAGGVGMLPPRQRFGQLVAPRSTVVQPSSVHTGFSDDPEATLEHLLRVMVHPPDGERGT
jgi:hypothetical protein